MATEPQAAGGRYWLLIGDVPLGPFDVAQIHAKLAAGEVSWQARACPVGGSTWLPLVQMPGVGPGTPHRSEAVRAGAPDPRGEPPGAIPVVLLAGPSDRPPAPGPRPGIPEGRSPHTAAPWNPAVIAWLGLVFTPMWAGVMAALNGKRLAAPSPVWPPILIGFGYLGLDLAREIVFESYLLSVLSYLGAVALLWAAVLRPQAVLFARWQASAPGPQARWLWPTTAGLPLALLVFIGFVVEPLRLLEPREVCERFTQAGTAREAERYVTQNLVPAVQALSRLNDTGEDIRFELTDEAPAPAEVGGYLVGFRFTFVEASRPQQMEGVFHLVHWGGEWKIEDVHFTAVNRQPVEPWVSLARNHHLLQPTQPTRIVTNAAPGAGGQSGARGTAPANPAAKGGKGPEWSNIWGKLLAGPAMALMVWLLEKLWRKWGRKGSGRRERS
jgi:hypothetical protein